HLSTLLARFRPPTRAPVQPPPTRFAAPSPSSYGVSPTPSPSPPAGAWSPVPPAASPGVALREPGRIPRDYTPSYVPPPYGNPPGSDPLPETTEIARRPHQDAVANFDLGIGEEILDGRGHRFRRFRRAARRLDADAEHAVAIRRGAFNFLGRSLRVDEGYLWTCWPGPPDARGAFDVRESTRNAPRARRHRIPPRPARPHRRTRGIPPVMPRNAVPGDPGGHPPLGRDRSDAGHSGSPGSSMAQAFSGIHPRVVPTTWRAR